ncbi:single-stranded-DNA-specific exonuclease RecJ [bacterium]|nr:single-stranded-DNA-specific exonuclease RecJ [bacterium]
MKSKWEYFNPINPEAIGEMVEKLRMPRPVVRVLNNRGFVNIDKIREFLNPNTDQLHDPFLIKDMELAVNRIITALREREEILIFGDYDVDGITSVSMLYLFLKDLCGQVSFYIPDRATEGYGISTAGIEEARKKGASLIISVDCGITSVEEVEFARKFGIDVIVSDHHEPGEVLPEAVAVLDPKRIDCDYPFKELAGVGVAYKLAQGIVQKLELNYDYIEKYLDLVAIGSAADIVPLVDENRVFVRVGLEKLNKDGQEGILTLIDTAGFHPGNIDVGQIIYGLAPRINAVGRLGRATPAVELIITRNHLNAQKIALELEEKNRLRKEIDNKTLLEALVKMETYFHLDHDFVVVLAGEGWHPGVIGIVASRIIEKYFRPTVMISIENGIGKGSARSIPNFDLYGALKSCSDLLLQFGGHKYAAGLTIEAEKIPEFRNRFNEVASNMLQDDDLIPKIKIDDELRLEEINTELIQMLEGLAPFGPKNNKPCFVSYGLEVVGYPRIVGRNHLKFKVRQNGTVFNTIAFNRGADLQQLQENRYIDMIYYVEENNWMNRTSLQLKVKDFR